MDEMFDLVKRIYWNIYLDIIGIQHGKLISIISPVYIYGNITIGDCVSLNHNVTINALPHGEIIIGNNVSIGMNSVIRACNHDYTKGEGHLPGKIKIGDRVWIGANCVILPNVNIGSGSVVGAGSVVTRSIPENVVAVGNPCTPIKTIERPPKMV